MTNKSRANKSKAGTEPSGEQISSMVDGELDDTLDDKSCFDHLVENKEAGHRWERYHLISDALKRNLPRFIDNQLASRVMAELENEPTVLAPPRANSLIGKQVAGLAIAASVATVAVLGVQFMYKEDGMAPLPQVAQLNDSKVQSSPLPASKVPVGKEFILRDVQTVTQTINPVDPHSQQRQAQILKRYHPNLNKYFLNHNQRAARGVVQGIIPYARIITYPDMERVASQKNIQNQSQNEIKK
jgi:sigma-E factor negative regulatory protein RseA